MTRLRPYTARGLAKVPCARCGRPSEHQWSLRPCATGVKAWHGLCREHDAELNRQTLRFFNVPDADRIVDIYEGKA